MALKADQKATSHTTSRPASTIQIEPTISASLEPTSIADKVRNRISPLQIPTSR